VLKVLDGATKDKIQLLWDALIGNKREESYGEDLALQQHESFHSQMRQATERQRKTYISNENTVSTECSKTDT